MKSTVHLIFQQEEINTSGKKKISVQQWAWSHESKGTKCFPSGEGGCGSYGRFQTSLNYQSQAGAWGSQKKKGEVQLERISPSLPEDSVLILLCSSFAFGFPGGTSGKEPAC